MHSLRQLALFARNRSLDSSEFRSPQLRQTATVPCHRVRIHVLLSTFHFLLSISPLSRRRRATGAGRTCYRSAPAGLNGRFRKWQIVKEPARAALPADDTVSELDRVSVHFTPRVSSCVQFFSRISIIRQRGREK